MIQRHFPTLAMVLGTVSILLLPSCAGGGGSARGDTDPPKPPRLDPPRVTDPRPLQMGLVSWPGATGKDPTVVIDSTSLAAWVIKPTRTLYAAGRLQPHIEVASDNAVFASGNLVGRIALVEITDGTVVAGLVGPDDFMLEMLVQSDGRVDLITTTRQAPLAQLPIPTHEEPR